ncbi:DUF551 domain-containing protein [Enterobacter sp. 37]|uniref:DUF551 domain-containing protein n=1 Tax=Enterobacter sp. 37 TaxID=3085083 RepID=UPI002FC7F9EE
MSTITKEFTKEQLIERLQHRISVASGFPESEKAQMDLELARIALASLEAEVSGRNPVLAYADSYRDMAKQGVESIPVWSVITDLERNIAPLYTAPPAPVSVPDEDLLHMAASAIDDLLSNKDRSGAGVWADIPAKLRRAAMLQGADPVQAWIPCSERMPDTMISVLVTGDWFRHAVSFWDGASWCDLDFEPPVTHWQPLPAAPQQEVKP